ncbi:transposase [Streptomyces sp. NPDC014685]|uniref:transposase n=1 Tax=Streptomyces sp. NPDC014685 TaxID=3364881 RepID=UPI0036F5CBE7
MEDTHHRGTVAIIGSTGSRNRGGDRRVRRFRLVSRGPTTRIHLTCEQGQKPLSLLITAGQRGDSPQFEPVLNAIGVPPPGVGRPRSRPLRVRGDRAYSSRANRASLRRRGIRCTIPEPADQVCTRRRRGRGGEPSACRRADAPAAKDGLAVVTEEGHISWHWRGAVWMGLHLP